MVSGDAIIQAAATMIVGATFLVALRQAMGLETRGRQLVWLIGPFMSFAMSASFATIEEAPIATGYPEGSMLWLAKGCFVLGMFSIIFVLLHIQSEVENQEKKPKRGIVIRQKDETPSL